MKIEIYKGYAIERKKDLKNKSNYNIMVRVYEYGDSTPIFGTSENTPLKSLKWAKNKIDSILNKKQLTELDEEINFNQ